MNETHVKIIEAWEARAKAQFLVHPDDIEVPDTEGLTEEEEGFAWDHYESEKARNTYSMQQLEFFIGAQMALELAGLPRFPDMFLVILSAGRKASDFKPKVTA